ncbi:MAG: hypothetical protein IKM94_01000, partial [Alphaproteobacteria bacterium]|nr:hypothetical protein [Alphaproteobacteria bacterium]
VTARAATTQKAIVSGTKIAGATSNTIVSEECKEKYYGCMDSFCMLDNANGGRCLCSNRNEDLDKVLEEIQKLDEQSYAMATSGVERINMGADADAVDAIVNKIANKESAVEKKKARSLNLDLWNDSNSFDDDDNVFSSAEDIANLKGDELHAAVADMCVNQIPECSKSLSMLKMMYAQQIRSDCTAYENSLKKQRNESAKKLQTAQTALREAALEQHQNANKYDLGQCTIRFKQCIQTTAGCGDDFSKCAAVVATDKAQTAVGKKQKVKNYTISGAVSSITIAASTYDTLLAKKPMCESVTKQCVAVQDKVWDAFLREAAPELKSAELIAESNVRMNCIANISECFQKACKDTMDPNDPDGSYDMCLSRPETMRSLCKVQIDPCEAAEPKVLDYVYARLASMRVDSCTTEVKECLQSDDRCGSDYSKCIGLDTDTIIRMCPYDKLVGCQKVYADTDIRGDKVYDEISTMVEGIMLNIDNSMLTQCQNAANEAMIKVCGDTENCNGLTVDANVGTRSLEYKICEYSGDTGSLAINYSSCRTDVSQVSDSDLGRGTGVVKPLSGVLDGTVYWEKVTYADDGTIAIPDMEGATAAQTEKVKSELAQLQTSINNAIKAIESDPKVQFCMTGREVQGMNGKKIGSRNGKDAGKNARFPDLTKQMRMIIAQAAVKAAKDNYYKKYDELNEKMLKDYVTLGERLATVQGENAKDARREIARQACVSMADASSLPKSPNPPKNPFGKVLATAAIVGAAVAVPFTGGASMIAVGGVLLNGAAVAGVAVAGIGLLGNAGSNGANGADASLQKDLVGSKALNQWNYKETITSTFEWETLKCRKCTRTQKCSVTKNPIFGDKYCKTWATPTENCVDTQF